MTVLKQNKGALSKKQYINAIGYEHYILHKTRKRVNNQPKIYVAKQWIEGKGLVEIPDKAFDLSFPLMSDILH